jgi:hypothetical protein
MGRQKKTKPGTVTIKLLRLEAQHSDTEHGNCCTFKKIIELDYLREIQQES